MDMTPPDAANARLERVAAAMEARELTIAYDGVERVRNVTAVFPRNRVTAILGPSGCGKSTLLRALNRTLELVPGARVPSGRVFLDRAEIYRPDIAASWVRTRVGMLQQRPFPFPMSIAENVLFGARYHTRVRDCEAEARRYLELVGLWSEVKERLDDSAATLSGGQQQRLCLARTLAVKPEVVLMDEPCSALDPRATAVIEALVRELASTYTIVVVTHNIAQARRIADHCIFMLDGEVLDSGPRDEVLVHPRHPVVSDFVSGRIG